MSKHPMQPPTTPSTPIGNNLQAPAPIFYFTGNRNVIHIHHHTVADNGGGGGGTPTGGSLAGMNSLMPSNNNLRFVNPPSFITGNTNCLAPPNSPIYNARNLQQQRYYNEQQKTENNGGGGDAAVPDKN